jgi:hypothetical protein
VCGESIQVRRFYRVAAREEEFLVRASGWD